jgi:hypothetical protein
LRGKTSQHLSSERQKETNFLRKKLTDLSVRSLAPGKYFDLTTPAFGIRVGKSRRTWIVMRGQERQLIRIGHYPAVSLQDARTEAKRLLASAQPPTGRVTFGEAYEMFKKTHIALKKPSTQRGYPQPAFEGTLPSDGGGMGGRSGEAAGRLGRPAHRSPERLASLT